MPRSRLEVADVFRRYGPAYREAHGLTGGQQRVMRAIARCRTAALGGHLERCDACGYARPAYDSCRNRHCPKCQALARAAWLAARRAELLPTEYFHVVFTVPEAVAAIALQNKAVVYGLLFRATAETLRTIGADPQHLGAELGFLAVLHTWGQTLLHHPHVHCVVPGGGLSLDGPRWIACRPGFFLPVRVLSRLFRRLFLAQLATAFERGRLHFTGALAPLRDPAAFRQALAPLRAIDWVVYAKPPFGGPAQVLEYLGRDHPPGRDRQPPPPRNRAGPGALPLARLSGSQPAEDHDAGRGRVPPALPPPRPPHRVPPHPPLRLPRQSPPRGQARALPAPAGDALTRLPRAPRPPRLPGRLRDPHRALPPRVSGLPARRDTAGCPAAPGASRTAAGELR